MNLVLTISTLLFLCLPIFSVKLSLNLQSNQERCFSQILQKEQKYSVDSIPEGPTKYTLAISYIEQGNWKNIYFKEAQTYEILRVHKIAPKSATFSYCVTNLDSNFLKMSLDFKSGLELLDFESLPTKSDSENIKREVEWLEGQGQKLRQTLNRIQSLRASAQSLGYVVGAKFFYLAMMGLVSIGLVNFFLYNSMKKELKGRKLI